MSSIVIANAQVWDGVAAGTFPATVVVEGRRIAKVVRAEEPSGDLPGERIDGTGMTLMPGMVEGHCHPSFTGVTYPLELGHVSPERHMLLTAKNLRLLLEHGFTSIFEAASAKPLLGVNARDAIEEGLLAGPRMRAGSPEITTTAGLGDERKRHIYSARPFQYRRMPTTRAFPVPSSGTPAVSRSTTPPSTRRTDPM